jgi:hypothetical protein
VALIVAGLVVGLDAREFGSDGLGRLAPDVVEPLDPTGGGPKLVEGGDVFPL